MTGDNIKGTIPCQLFGGPLDGAAYADLPDTGGPLTGFTLSVPLEQPHETSPHAVYICRGGAPVHGRWQFFYHHTEPASVPVRDEVRAVEAPVGTQLMTTGPVPEEI